jgi:predicted HTH domain antitoxin
LAIERVRKDRSIPTSDLFSIARQFDVSVEALLWRIHLMYNRSEEETRRDIGRWTEVAPSVEDRERYQPPNRPARFEALAKKAFRRGEISQGKFAEYLGISRREAQRYVEQEALVDEEVSLPPA